jgi:hypothetical protein
MTDNYRVYSSTKLFGKYHLNESSWIWECNRLIAEGWIPLGGMVHFGNTGLMQSMYKAPDKEFDRTLGATETCCT